MNKKKLANELKRPLSGKEILEKLDHKANILLYRDLYNVKDLDEVLGKHKACVILYETVSEFNGHWCCVFEQDKDTIEFHDSYGYLIDSEISPEFMKEDIIEKYYNGPILRRLIYDSKYKNIVYNDKNLQERYPGISTCGRFVICRLLWRDVELNKYINNLKSFKINLDQLVTLITELI